MNLIRKKPNEIYRCEIAESLKQMLKQMQTELTSLKKDLSNGNEKIKKYCHDLRTDVQLASEMAIHEINTLNTIMINQINTYEIECFRSFEKETHFKEKMNKQIGDIAKFCNEWIECKQLRMSSEEALLEANEQAKSLQVKLAFKRKELDSFLFNNKLLEFNKSKLKHDSATLLGTLRFEDRTKTTSVFYDDLMNEINLADLIAHECNKTIHSILGEYLDKSKLFVAYKLSSLSQLSYLVIDTQHHTVVYSVNDNENRFLENLKVLKKKICINLYETKESNHKEVCLII
jgi:hypothetical protein